MKKLKALRESLNLRQEDLALKLSVDRSTVAKWETGESMPRVDKLRILATILKCSVDDLLCENI